MWRFCFKLRPELRNRTFLYFCFHWLSKPLSLLSFPTKWQTLVTNSDTFLAASKPVYTQCIGHLNSSTDFSHTQSSLIDLRPCRISWPHFFPSLTRVFSYCRAHGSLVHTCHGRFNRDQPKSRPEVLVYPEAISDSRKDHKLRPPRNGPSKGKIPNTPTFVDRITRCPLMQNTHTSPFTKTPLDKCQLIWGLGP